MIDAKKVRYMTKLAAYEEGYGKRDLRIHNYTERNYVSIQMAKTLVCVTIGYGILMVLYSFRFYSDVASRGFELSFAGFILPAFLIYAVIIALSIILSRITYKKRFRQMKSRIEEYDRNLNYLQKHMQEKKQSS